MGGQMREKIIDGRLEGRSSVITGVAFGIGTAIAFLA